METSQDISPVAWAQLGLKNGRSYLRMAYDREPYPPPADVVRNLNLKPLFEHPDPRIAALEALLRDWIECKRDKLELFDATVAALGGP